MSWSITSAQLESASDVVSKHAVETRLLAVPALGENVWLKLECEQHTGSFKFRGALSRLAALDSSARARGVLTASAGNHGYGLARAGTLLDVPVTVFVAASTPAVKREGIAAAGATLEVIDVPGYDAVEARAKEAAVERGLPFVSPFDDPVVAAGNGGTVMAEILRACPTVRTVVAPVGGGGLMAGIAAARRWSDADFAIIGVQSEACPAMVQSLAEGRARLTYEGTATLAEGLEGGVSRATFEIARDELQGMHAVTEAQVADAMCFASTELGLSIEGSAAVVIAWLKLHVSELDGPVVGVVSGGNVDPKRLADLLVAAD